MKSLELDEMSEYWPVIKRPNIHMSQAQLVQVTSLWLSLRGEAWWLLLNESGDPVLPGDVPDEIVPASPDFFEPRYDELTGDFIGWYFHGTPGLPEFSPYAHQTRIPLMPSEVVQFKYPNPYDMLRGLSPISAAASGINLDLLADEHNRATIRNGAEPGGLWSVDGAVSDAQMKAFERQVEQRHGGPSNRRRNMVLRGAWTYTPTSLTPQDMDYLESKRWNRDSVFAAMRCPKASAGITDDLNYATMRASDRNLWDKSLLPDVSMIENTIDHVLMRGTRDDQLIAFDLSGIDELRFGLGDRIDDAKKLMSKDVHMPPRTAFEYVGLYDVPEYPGDDVAIIDGMGTLRIGDVLEPQEPAVEPPPVEPGEDGDDPDAGVEDLPDELGEGRSWDRAPGARTKRRQNSVHEAFLAVQGASETTMRRVWRSWVGAERALQLAAFDEWAESATSRSGRVVRSPDPDEIILPISLVASRLGTRFRPQYVGSLELTYQHFSSEIGGVPVFQIDDPALVRTIDQRTSLITSTVPRTQHQLLRESIAEGFAAGEPRSALRQRVADVYDIQASSAKTLTVARTESGGFMNGAREQMFTQQAPDGEYEWSTASDEHVRATHRFFGGLDPVPLGFNFLSAEDYPGKGTGILEHPGDTRASASEVVSCRCVKLLV
jgi:hypothetical protein